MGVLSIKELLREVDISTEEVIAYVKYFDWKRSRVRAGGFEQFAAAPPNPPRTPPPRLCLTWEHFTVRAFVLSVSYLGNGYYSALRKVKDTILFADISELDGFRWLKGWIFQKDKDGMWYVVVDGETDDFKEFKRVYNEVKGKW